LAATAGSSGVKALQRVAAGQFPIVLMAGAIDAQWGDWLAEGVIDDLISLPAGADYWRLRLEMVARTFRRNQELRVLRETTAISIQNPLQVDPATGIYNRTALLSLLFRETDRVQRMNTCLTLALFDLAGGNSGLIVDSQQALIEVVPRLNRLLRSYDLLGKIRKDTFLIALPGCTEENAVRLVERAQSDVFTNSFTDMPGAGALPVCFGVAESYGRSPLVVLREAEQALRQARAEGLGVIRSFGRRLGPRSDIAASGIETNEHTARG
jgi:diguanylate cyclase (GGDEF)-like protein